MFAEQYEMLKRIDDEKEKQIHALRDKEQMLKEQQKQELRDNQIKLEIAETKKKYKTKKKHKLKRLILLGLPSVVILSPGFPL